MKKILIISDGKQGHLSQSIAFCQLKSIDYDIMDIQFKSLFHKGISYLFDRFGFYTDSLYLPYQYPNKNYQAIVSTGSSTYYINKILSKLLNIKSIVLMYPKGYKTSGFTHIISQSHDKYRKADNITEVPLNLSFPIVKGVITQASKQHSLAIIIGGNNDIFKMNEKNLEEKIDDIFRRHPEHLKYVTTSRRTPKAIESIIKSYDFDYQLIYSDNPGINPIGDFIKYCELFFITIDSTAMISEVRANTNAKIELIYLNSRKENTKYHRLIKNIEKINEKVDFHDLLKGITL